MVNKVGDNRDVQVPSEGAYLTHDKEHQQYFVTVHNVAGCLFTPPLSFLRFFTES